MINIRELRIGNKILRRNGSDNQPEWVECTVNLTYMQLISEFPEDYKPIPLTEDWLNRLGFEEDKETKSWSILTAMDKFDYLFEISNRYQEHFQPDFMQIDIKYLHQLQNLYFASTDKELELK